MVAGPAANPLLQVTSAVNPGRPDEAMLAAVIGFLAPSARAAGGPSQIADAAGMKIVYRLGHRRAVA
jgi:hypothetical protein